jgi:hypothetical protein
MSANLRKPSRRSLARGAKSSNERRAALRSEVAVTASAASRSTASSATRRGVVGELHGERHVGGHHRLAHRRHAVGERVHQCLDGALVRCAERRAYGLAELRGVLARHRREVVAVLPIAEHALRQLGGGGLLDRVTHRWMRLSAPAQRPHPAATADDNIDYTEQSAT